MAVVNVHLDPATKAALDAQAAAEQRSLRAVVLRAITMYLAVHDSNHKAA